MFAGASRSRRELRGWALESHPAITSLRPIDTYHRSRETTNLRVQTEVDLQSLRTVLARIKARLYEFLIETERQLEFGQVNATRRTGRCS